MASVRLASLGLAVTALSCVTSAPREAPVAGQSAVADDRYGGATALHLVVSPKIAERLIAAGVPVGACDSFGRSPLHLAAQRGAAGDVRVLLAHGADARARDDRGLTPLHDAATRAVASLLIRHGADVNALTEDDGQAPLHRARSAEVAAALLDAGAETDRHDAMGRTPLHHAVLEDRGEVARLLLARGADVSAPDLEGVTPLHFVRSRLMAALLVGAGADPNVPTADGETSLHWAESEEIIAVLTGAGANVAAADCKGHSVLHVLAARGDAVSTGAVLRLGAPPDPTDDLGATPLNYAVRNDHLEVVGVLLANGADPQRRAHEGATPLHWAASAPVALELLVAGAEIEARDGAGQTPLHAAVGRDHADVVDLLVGLGADVNARTGLVGFSPLHLARSDAVVDHLVLSGADVNARDQEGRTPLHLAAARGDKAAVDALLRRGAIPAATATRGGWTPLHSAANADIARSLLAAGADPNARDAGAATPLHWAAGTGKLEVIDALLEGGASLDSQDGEGRTPLWWAMSSGQKAAATRLLSASGGTSP
jgi:ankyrin repeat protein